MFLHCPCKAAQVVLPVTKPTATWGPRWRRKRRRRTGRKLWRKKRCRQWERDFWREMKVPIHTIVSCKSESSTDGERCTMCWTGGSQQLEAKARHCYRCACWYAVCNKMVLWTHFPSDDCTSRFAKWLHCSPKYNQSWNDWSQWTMPWKFTFRSATLDWDVEAQQSDRTLSQCLGRLEG